MAAACAKSRLVYHHLSGPPLPPDNPTHEHGVEQPAAEIALFGCEVRELRLALLAAAWNW